MATFFRLSQCRLTNQLIKNEKIGLLSIIRSSTSHSAAAPLCDNHEERNMKLGRPQSPHLTIYQVQLTSLLSISHRISGMALSAYAIAFGIGSLALPESIPTYIDSLAAIKIGAAPLFIGKGIIAFPLCYHFWNGIRHLSWDMGKFLSLKEVYSTGYVVVFLTIASALGIASL